MGKSARMFSTGATRDDNKGKLEYARFLDPKVLEVFARYMDKHRVQSDGELRDPDNWKKGMELQAYMDSLMRHVHDLWLLHEGYEAVRPETGEKVNIIDTLCGILFNAFGYLYEVLRNMSTKWRV